MSENPRYGRRLECYLKPASDKMDEEAVWRETDMFRFLTPLYGFSSGIRHVAVVQEAEKQLRDMGALVGSNHLVAIYVPEGTEDVYQPGNRRGRVVGSVKLKAMPPDKTIGDFFEKDWDGSLRWPIGWPCEAVHSPTPGNCPTLRSLVVEVHGPNAFNPYVRRLRNGPIELDQKMAKKLEKWFP